MSHMPPAPQSWARAFLQFTADNLDGATAHAMIIQHGNATLYHGEDCLACAMRDCPHHEPLHHHHDGCPACSIQK